MAHSHYRTDNDSVRFRIRYIPTGVGTRSGYRRARSVGRAKPSVNPTMKRRKVLAGLGSLAAGGAAAIGTGAFTAVEADRGVRVSTADDNDALLQIRRSSENGSVTPNAQEYVKTKPNGTVVLDFSGKDGSSLANGASGINRDATTIIDNLLRIRNQGTQEVIVGYVGLTANGNELSNQGFALYHEDPNSSVINGGSNILNLQRGVGKLPRLEPGEEVNNVGAFFFGNVDVSAINGSNIQFFAADEASDLTSSGIQ
jgi:hypothetical protein